MTLPDGAYVTPEGWVVLGDEAYLPDEKLPRSTRPYRRLTDEERATYHRDWMRAYRARQRYGNVPVASLHDLKCTGPTRLTGCRCSKIPMYEGTP